MFFSSMPSRFGGFFSKKTKKNVSLKGTIYYFCSVKETITDMEAQAIYLEDAEQFIDSLPEKAQKKIYYNIDMVCAGVRDDRIFKKLKEAPEIARDLRKLMSYYLPTTEKLLQSYVDLRKETHNVENIVKSQKEIEEATDVINDAFVKLLNQLFESTSWDISSDISVLKTMMKQDAHL